MSAVSAAMETLSSTDASCSSPDSASLMPAVSPAKRSAADAGLKTSRVRSAKSVKRRASKACQCCRARKVRCNVVENGPPCTNCRLDEVDCLVSESKRKKKWSTPSTLKTPSHSHQSHGGPLPINPPTFPASAHPPYEPLKRLSEHVPHTLYQDLGRDLSLPAHPRPSMYAPDVMLGMHQLGPKPPVSEPSPLLPSFVPTVRPCHRLPLYVKPLPSKLAPEDMLYLERKGALTIPPTPLRDELLRSFVDFVYPHMPLLNLHELITTIDRCDGATTISLLLFQAILFSATATVSVEFLRSAGYVTRRDARRDFFRKTRLLYDFDVEMDRISLIQSLLLMSYWYETPDDQKDSHHWIGIAVSLSHTIGLHRNPDKSAAMDEGRRKLWKRVWWSTYTRDRLVALGMRRQPRIKNADFDVPMLALSDFEIAALPAGPSCIPANCKLLRSTTMQTELAVTCIEKAKLCICMSHVLSVQYSVLNDNHDVLDEGSSSLATARLIGRKREPEVDEVHEMQVCDRELQEWKNNLPREARYIVPSRRDVDSGYTSLVLHRSLLHMIYYATRSALHRPQVLPSAAMPLRPARSDLLEYSRRTVRVAACEITSIAYRLYNLDMVGYLPTTGITVLLPAIIIHLLDIKAPDETTRRLSLQGFCQCMQIMGKLRDIYAAADYSSAFLEAAIRKAEITLPQKTDEITESRTIITSAQGLVDAGSRMQLVFPVSEQAGALTPPPDDLQPQAPLENGQLTDNDIARKLSSFLASTPPVSEDTTTTSGGERMESHGLPSMLPDFEPDFESLINLDAAGEFCSLEDGAFAAMSGESGGFAMDMDWLKGMKDDGIAASG